MKCRYKKPMEYFYLTKDDYKEFLNKIIITYPKVEDLTDNGFFCEGIYYSFNRYYVREYGLEGYYKVFSYTKEEFEEKFEVIN